MNESNALQTITLLPMSRGAIKDFTFQVAEAVMEGNVDPVRLAVYIKSLEELTKAIKDHYQVKDAISDGVALYPEKTFLAFGAEITKSNRTTYNYEGCQDQVYNELIQQQNQLKAIIKAREEMLKVGINPETGETFHKPVSETTSFLTIKLK